MSYLWQRWKTRMERIWTFYQHEKKSLMHKGLNSRGLYVEVSRDVFHLPPPFEDWWMGFRDRTFLTMMFVAKANWKTEISGGVDYIKVLQSYQRSPKFMVHPVPLIQDRLKRVIGATANKPQVCSPFALVVFKSVIVKNPQLSRDFIDFDCLPVVFPYPSLPVDKAYLRRI